MAYEPKDNTGSLFKQPVEKMTKDTSPPYEGDFKLVCPHCHAEARGWVKAWVRDSKVGKYFSLAFKFRERRSDWTPEVTEHKTRMEAQNLAPRRANGDDEIPF